MKLSQLKLSYISTTCLLRDLLRNLWTLLAAALICGLVTTIYLEQAYVPQYSASMTYAVMARQTGSSGSSSSTSQAATAEVTGVMANMLGTDFMCNQIRAYSDTLADFRGSVSAAQVGESNLMVVTTVSDSPESAYMAMLAVREHFPTIIEYVTYDCVVQVIRNPSVSSSPINYVNSTEASRKAALIGAGVMALLVVFFCLRRGTVQTRSAARDLIDASILATIRRVRKPLTLRRFFSLTFLRRLVFGKHDPVQVFDPSIGFAYTEQINNICSHMEHEAAAGKKLFMITGVGENEGKSTIAGNVAVALTQMGKRVAVLDCDLRNPSLNDFFGNRYTSKMPLNELLSQPFTKENLLQCVVRHDQLGVYMLLSTTPDKRCTELLTGENMANLLKQLHIFDFVILDTPPMGYFADTETLIDSVDASMLVVRQDHSSIHRINEAIALLREAKSHFMGCVLNDMTGSLTESDVLSYGYGYGYGYGHSYGYGSKSGSKRT